MQASEFPVVKIPKEKLVDTNGAGSFYFSLFIASKHIRKAT
jgi:sugar/nucleoside kinase (ribokinase family)